MKGDDVELALFVVVKEGDVRDILCCNCRVCIYACAYMVCANYLESMNMLLTVTAIFKSFRYTFSGYSHIGIRILARNKVTLTLALIIMSTCSPQALDIHLEPPLTV